MCNEKLSDSILLRSSNEIARKRQLDVLVEMDITIRSGREQPGLGGMEHRCQNAKLLDHLVASQNLDRDQKGVAHQIRVHHGMIDIDSSVVGCRCHERIAIVKRGRSDRTFVIFESFIRRVTEIQIKPNQSAIEASNDYVVAGRMDING